MIAQARRPSLLVRAGARICALPVEQVVETMRPLPTTPLAGTPPFVTGAAIVRGEAVPVVELGALLGDAAAAPRRFVLVRCGERRAALAVDEVLGVAEPEGLAEAPPLVAGAAGGAIEATGARGADLLLLLRASRLVPAETWARLDAAGTP